MKSSVFFITGTSGSGKSTLVGILKKELPFAEVHDFDEGGVPNDADEKWRKHKSNEWLNQAKMYQQNGRSTIICGVIVPDEVKNSPAYDKRLDVHYGFIYVNETEIRKRLQARGWKGKLVEDNVNWAKNLESHVKAEKDNYIVDGVKNKPNQVAQKFISWILQETLE